MLLCRSLNNKKHRNFLEYTGIKRPLVYCVYKENFLKYTRAKENFLEYTEIKRPLSTVYTKKFPQIYTYKIKFT